jgi:heptosyltransferase-2
MNKQILIIKLGYCETLINEAGFVPSLGDVFRHTALLHKYATDEVTWLTSQSAIPLLKDNPLIHRLLVYEEVSSKETLLNEEFDEVVCFEKARSICDLAESIKAKERYGFTWRNGKVEAVHHLAQSCLDIANGKRHFLPIQALLYQTVGDYWRGESYILGYRPRSKVQYDVGLNHLVGNKWPTKAWPETHWKKLNNLCLKYGLKTSWQQGEKDIEVYMDWIHSCRLIVTCDSLGMHLALAMHKKTVALFGPTPSEDIYMYGLGIILRSSTACPHSPCFSSICRDGGVCMSDINPETVFQVILNMEERQLYQNLKANISKNEETKNSFHHDQPEYAI